jgi:superfamily II DNA or RNA helicase
MPPDPVLILFMYTRYEKIPFLLRNRIGMYIVDEAPLHCTVGRVAPLLSLAPKYIITLSATMERNDGLEKIIYLLAGEHKVERLSENPFRMIRLKTGIRIDEEKTNFGVNYAKFVNSQANCEERNLQIIDIVKHNSHRKYIILTKTVEHVDNLNKLFKDHGIHTATYFGNKKSYVDEKILIGSISKLGIGFDMAMCAKEFDGISANTLILTTSIKQESLLKQVIGRVLNRAPDPVIVFMQDKNASQTRHFSVNKKMMEDCNGTIIDAEYEPSELGGGIKF